MPQRDPTVAVPRELYGRAKRAIRLVRESGNRNYNMARFAREAFTAKLREIETIYNNGHAILPDPDPLERGRIAE